VASCAGATSTPGFERLVAGRRGPRAMTANDVAEQTLRALRRRGAIIPGAFNRFAQWLMSRLFPRRLAIRIMASQTKTLLRESSSGNRLDTTKARAERVDPRSP
jgi:short-subunit dehydrogenase